MQQYYDPYGAAQQYAPQAYAADPGAMAGQYQPYGGDPQFAPQGWLSNAFSVAKRVASNPFVQQGVRRFLPFGAEADFAPQGYADAGGGMAGQYAPYGVDPQFAPQGFFGNLIGKAAPTIGGMIGGRFGNAGLGRQIGGVASGLSRYIPFGAGPEFGPQGYAGDGGMAEQYQPYGVDPQFAPQGFFGNLIGKAAPTIGGMIGGRFGNAGLGRQIGGVASGLSRFIPFGAGPEFGPQGYAGDGGMAEQYQPYGVDPQFAPQGFFGNLIGRALPIAGSIWGGPVGGIAGQGAGALARRYIPFGADPMMMQEWA